jgi:hypothetical protein
MYILVNDKCKSYNTGIQYFRDKENMITENSLNPEIIIDEITPTNLNKIIPWPIEEILDICYLAEINLKINKFYIINIIHLSELKEWNNYDFCYQVVSLLPLSLQFCKNITKELCEIAISKDVWASDFIPQHLRFYFMDHFTETFDQDFTSTHNKKSNHYCENCY